MDSRKIFGYAFFGGNVVFLAFLFLTAYLESERAFRRECLTFIATEMVEQGRILCDPVSLNDGFCVLAKNKIVYFSLDGKVNFQRQIDIKNGMSFHLDSQRLYWIEDSIDDFAWTRTLKSFPHKSGNGAWSRSWYGPVKTYGPWYETVTDADDRLLLSLPDGKFCNVRKTDGECIRTYDLNRFSNIDWLQYLVDRDYVSSKIYETDRSFIFATRNTQVNQRMKALGVSFRRGAVIELDKETGKVIHRWDTKDVVADIELFENYIIAVVSLGHIEWFDRNIGNRGCLPRFYSHCDDVKVRAFDGIVCHAIRDFIVGTKLANGKEVWRVGQNGFRPVGCEAFRRFMAARKNCVFLLDNELVFMAGGVLKRISPTDGSLRMRSRLGGRMDRKPLKVEDKLFVALKGGRVLCIDYNSGTLIWSHRL